MNYDENPVRVSAEYSYPAYREYFLFSLFKGKRYRLKRRLFFIGYPILIALASLELLIFGFDLFLIVCDAILILVLALFLLLVCFSPKRNYKHYAKLFTSDVLFAFRNHDFHAGHTNDLYTGESTVKYETLYKAYETRTMFFLFLTPRQAYLINKNKFTAGDPADLREILRTELGKKKFILCR